MAVFRYTVFWAGATWRIMSNERAFGRFRKRDTAIAVAEGLVRQAVDEGHDAKLVVREPSSIPAPAGRTGA